MGWARSEDVDGDPARQTQRVVCFSETPLEHVNLLLGPMEPSRQIVMEPYGVALTKLSARKRGVNPVWYVDTTSGRYWTLANALNWIRDYQVEYARQHGQDFHEYEMAKIFPFIDMMGTWPSLGSQKEFWWEREWRHVGHFTLPDSGVIWLCLEEDVSRLQSLAGRDLQPWIDPGWGLEAIIAHLAEFDSSEVSPFV